MLDVVRKWETLLFVGFIVSQPVIDIGTGLMTRYVNSVVTPGALIRTLLLFLIVPYIWKQLASRPVIRFLLMSAIGTIILTALISLVTKNPFFFTQEAVFYMKGVYYVASLFFIIVYMRRNIASSIDVSEAIVIMGFFIGGSYFLALLTKTSFPSYPYGEIGFSGWFFSANELSVIVLVSFASVLRIAREEPRIFTIAVLFLLAGTGVLIGTKTAYIGIAVLLGVTLIELIWTYKRTIFRQKQTLIYVVLALLFFSIFPFAPMTTNRVQQMEQATEPYGPHIESLGMNEAAPMDNILSSRQEYVKKVATDFSRAPTIRKLFGLGYAGDYDQHPKMIEMDFFELFFSFGWIGTIVLLTPLVYVGSTVLTRTIRRPKHWVLLTALGLTLAISATAGHVLFAPSVMSYIIISISLLPMNKRRVPRM